MFEIFVTSVGYILLNCLCGIFADMLKNFNVLILRQFLISNKKIYIFKNKKELILITFDCNKVVMAKMYVGKMEKIIKYRNFGIICT